MRLTAFLAFLLCLTGSTLWWAARSRRIWSATDLRVSARAARWSWIFAGAQIAGLCSLFFLRNGQSEASQAWSRPMATVLFVWYLIGVPLFLVGVAGDLFWRSLRWIAERLFPARAKPAPRPPSEGPQFQNSEAGSVETGGIVLQPLEGVTRRDWISAAAHSAPAVFSLGSPAISAWQLEHFRVRKLEVPLADLPEALDGFTITHLSDTHVGRFTHGRILSAIVETTQGLDSDLICFTGDLINFSLGDLPPAVEMLRALHARCGVYVCEGNHDLMHSAVAFRRGLEKASLRLLTDDSALVPVGNHRVQIFGLPWAAQQREDQRRAAPVEQAAWMQNLTHQIRDDAFPILLAHHPHSFDDADRFRLTLSGHTHGGQLMLTPRFGCGPAFYRYWSGLHLRGRRALCVSNGVGNWFPIRVSAPAEIIQLTLRPENASESKNAARSSGEAAKKRVFAGSPRADSAKGEARRSASA